jgi:hypothetical protein
MGVRQATRWLVLGIMIVGGGCARRRATVEVEGPVTRTWVGEKPVPPSERTTPPAPTDATQAGTTAAGSGATATPDPAVVAPAVDPSTPPPAPPADMRPPTPPVKRGGWVKAGSWNR